MNFLEKDLEAMIYESSQTLEGRKSLADRGLSIHGKMLRQVSLGEFGVADLITLDYTTTNWNMSLYRKPHSEGPQGCWKRLTITIYELKKRSLGIDSLLQVMRYKWAILNFHNTLIPPGSLKFVTVKMVLIGSNVNYQDDTFRQLREMSDNLQVYTCNYNLDGLKFDKMYQIRYLHSFTNKLLVHPKFTTKSFVKSVIKLGRKIDQPDKLNNAEYLEETRRIDMASHLNSLGFPHIENYTSLDELSYR